MQEGETGQTALDLRIVFAALCFFFAMVAAVYARPTGPFVLVVTEPGGGAAVNMETIGKAEGRFVWSGRIAWMSVAYSDDASFPERLRAAGAVMVFNHRLALGCAKEL